MKKFIPWLVLFIALTLTVMRVSLFVTNNREYKSTFDRGHPSSLELLVEVSSAIIVGRFVELSDEGTVSVITPFPSESYLTPSLPELTLPIIGTHFVVDEILKNDGEITVNQVIETHVAGYIPSGTAEVATDAASDEPSSWPEDTEFVVFLVKQDSESPYEVQWGACGKVLTTGDNVTCADGNRTILPFMEGLDRDEFIAAIENEVESPSSTETPPNTHTPYPTATNTPCPVIPCP